MNNMDKIAQRIFKSANEIRLCKRHKWCDGAMVFNKIKGYSFRLQLCKCGKSRVKPKTKKLL
jgi:hypothetical protein